MTPEEITASARQRIAAGEAPDRLVHFVRTPDGEVMYLSTSLSPNENMAGLTERYYTLEQLAA